MQAVILAGGLGTRLRATLGDAVPKPMAPIGDRPFLAYVLDQLVDAGVDELVLLVGHRAEVLERYFGADYRRVPVVYVAEDEPRGTGGAVVGAQDVLADRFLLLNGDTYLRVDHPRLLRLLDTAPVAMSLVEVDDVGRFGAVRVADGRVTSFAEKTRSGPGLINGGVYALTRDEVERMPAAVSFSFESDHLQPQLARLRPAYVATPGPFFDIGVPEDYSAATDFLSGR